MPLFLVLGLFLSSILSFCIVLKMAKMEKIKFPENNWHVVLYISFLFMSILYFIIAVISSLFLFLNFLLTGI